MKRTAICIYDKPISTVNTPMVCYLHSLLKEILNFSYKLIKNLSRTSLTSLKTPVSVWHCAKPWTWACFVISLYHNPAMLELLVPLLQMKILSFEVRRTHGMSHGTGACRPSQDLVTSELKFSLPPTCMS